MTGITAYWPFDGSNINSKAMPLLEKPPTLTSTEVNGGTIYTPMTPSQAFEIARNIKGMYLKADNILFDYIVESTSNQDFESISFANIVKRATIAPNAATPSTNPNYTVCRTKFTASPGSAGVVNFVLDFAPGYYGLKTVQGSIKKYMFNPKLTLNMAGNYGALKASPTVAMGFFSWDNFLDNSVVSIPFNAVGKTAGITINSAIIAGDTKIIATERFDTIYASPIAGKAGDTITLLCPAIDPVNYNTTNHRVGFADVKEVWFEGAIAAVTPGTVLSATKFVLGSQPDTTVLDKITIKVPVDAKTGPITFKSVANTLNTAATTDYFTTIDDFIVLP